MIRDSNGLCDDLEKNGENSMEETERLFQQPEKLCKGTKKNPKVATLE